MKTTVMKTTMMKTGVEDNGDDINGDRYQWQTPMTDVAVIRRRR